ncbi:MAG: DUF58 domain-containing protein [Vicinamibacterales bacterium]
MSHHAPAATSLVDLNLIAKIELLILRRLAGGTTGDHRSRADGTGFDFVGLRDWQAGDRFSSIDWPQSTITNFAPMIVREFDQPSTATVLAVADASLSTRCGADGTAGAAVVARALATIGLSAAFFQDRFGLLAFDRGFSAVTGIAPRTGRGHVVHCLDAYESRRGLEPVAGASVAAALSGSLRTSGLVPVISDFLFEDALAFVRELAAVNVTHDVFLVLVDSRHAFLDGGLSSGWVTVRDVEHGAPQIVSRRTYRALAARAAEWQQEVARAARAADLDVVELGPDQARGEIALAEFVAERRLRKVAR